MISLVNPSVDKNIIDIISNSWFRQKRGGYPL